MEIRVLQYFLAVAREESISGAAEFLHLSQPTLSRQLKDMEEELGTRLFFRGNRKITLTEEGMLLRKRAEEIVSLVERTEKEVTSSDSTIAGDIYIGAGETQNVRILAKAAQHLQKNYPLIHYHIFSSDMVTILEQLDQGLLDLGIICGFADGSKYDYMPLPLTEQWSVLMSPNSPLARQTSISPEDLWDKPLILSRQALASGILTNWLSKDISSLNVTATYSLLYNASLLVEEGLGYALGFDRLINTNGNTALCSRPLSPALETPVNLIWKKHQPIPKAVEKYIHTLQKYAYSCKS